MCFTIDRFTFTKKPFVRVHNNNVYDYTVSDLIELYDWYKTKLSKLHYELGNFEWEYIIL